MADLIENCRRYRVMIGLLTVLRARAQQQEIRLEGSDVTLVPQYTGEVREITWLLDDRILVEIILKPQEEIIDDFTSDRTTINKANGALTIRNLITGDSGLYRAQVILMDDYIQVTKIRLTVRDCPDQPVISVESTEDQFVVSCKSFSPDVTFEWFNRTRSVRKSPFYTEPKKNGTLTCVVDNEVCNKRSSINFYIPDQPEVKSVGGNVTLVPKYTGDPSEIIWKVTGYKLVEMMLKPRVDFIFHRLQDRATISHTDGSLTIRHLTMEDSGVYTAVVLVNNDYYYYTEIRLESSGLSGGEKAGIAIVVLILILFLIFPFIALCYQYRDNRYVKPIYSFLTSNKESRVKNFERVHSFLYCCKGNPDKEEQHHLLAQSEQVKVVGSDVTLVPQYPGNLSAIYWRKDGEKLVEKDLRSQDIPKFERLQDRATINKDGSVTIKYLTMEDSGVYTAVAVGDNGHQNTEITLTICESSRPSGGDIDEPWYPFGESSGPPKESRDPFAEFWHPLGESSGPPKEPLHRFGVNFNWESTQN